MFTREVRGGNKGRIRWEEKDGDCMKASGGMREVGFSMMLILRWHVVEVEKLFTK